MMDHDCTFCFYYVAMCNNSITVQGSQLVLLHIRQLYEGNNILLLRHVNISMVINLISILKQEQG